jgi:hypothetical protein
MAKLGKILWFMILGVVLGINAVLNFSTPSLSVRFPNAFTQAVTDATPKTAPNPKKEVKNILNQLRNNHPRGVAGNVLYAGSSAR